MIVQNIFKNLPDDKSYEVFQDIIDHTGFKLERIISNGQITPPGEWYDQSKDEWVILLKGSARIRYCDQDEIIDLVPGDYIHIPAHKRHRVEETSKTGDTVWLALHY